MNLFGESGESIRTGFGLSKASAVLFGPSVLARNDAGVGDTILERGAIADILGHSARDLRPIWGHLAETSEHFDERAGSGEKGMKLQKRATPVEDGNE